MLFLEQNLNYYLIKPFDPERHNNNSINIINITNINININIINITNININIINWDNDACSPELCTALIFEVPDVVVAKVINRPQQ